MVEFNIYSDGRFLGSLEDLGLDDEIDVRIALALVQQDKLTWTQFIRRHGWVPRPWFGDNTYPGAMDLHDFVVLGPSGKKYQITGCTDDEAVVICAVAVVFQPTSRSAAALANKPEV